jgi:MFS family permease
VEPLDEERRAPRRERLAWLIGFGIGSMAWNICWPFLPLRVYAVGVGDLSDVARIAGLLAGGTNLVTALLGPFWSQLGERFGYRLQIMRAHLGTSLSMSLIGLAATPLQLAGAGVVLGTLGGNYPHYMALVASRTAASEVGRVVGDMQAAGQVGGTIGPLIGGLVASRLGLPAAFVVSGLVSLTGIVVIGALVRPDQGGRHATGRPRGGVREALGRPETRRLMLLMLAGDAAVQGLRPLIPVMIQARLGDASAVATATGLATTLQTGATVIAALVVGRLSRRVAPRQILLVTLPAAVLCAGAVPLVDDLSGLMVLWTLLGLSSGATVPAIFAWLGRVAPSSSGGFALLATASMLAFALGPAVMGQATVYGLEAPFRLAALCTLGGVVLVFASDPKPVAAQAAG